MKIFVSAKPSSKTEAMEKIDETHFRISVREAPIHGQANAAIVKVLADYFETTVAKVKIMAGRASRNKIIEINF